MEQTFDRIGKHFYKRQYESASGDWITLYYARFVCRLKKKRRIFPLGSELAAAKDKLKKLEAQDVDRYDFDLGRQRAPKEQKPPEGKPRDGKIEPFTFAEWSEVYLTFDDVKRKRSLATDLTLIRLHLRPFFGAMLLTEIARETLRRYVDSRTGATSIRRGSPSKVGIKRGTVSNELSLLRRMLRVAQREEYKVIVPSFEDLIVRTKRGGRELSEEEQKKVLAVYAPWMRRLAEFDVETCLSRGDLLRLTEDMIHMTPKGPVVIPDDGRLKTQATTDEEKTQIAPLTKRANQILEEIRAERKNGAAIPNVKGLIFTNPDGSPITKGQIEYQVEKALKETSIKKFTFHCYRNTALTEWARRGMSVDHAMLASGHSSVQMHKRYVRLKAQDIAEHFRTGSQMVTRIVTRKRRVVSK